MIRDAPIEEMDCSIGVTGVSRIMRHHADRGALAVQFTEQFHHGLSISRIQVARGLIRKQNGWLAAQRSSDGDALLLAARELRRIVLHPMRHLHFFRRFFGHPARADRLANDENHRLLTPVSLSELEVSRQVGTRTVLGNTCGRFLFFNHGIAYRKSAELCRPDPRRGCGQ